MVYLVIDPRSAHEAVELARQTGCAVWVGSDAMSEQEHLTYARAGMKLTRFAFPLAGATSEEIEDALSTVREHHPNEIVWVQYVSQT